MEADKKPDADDTDKPAGQSVPQDALEKTNEELGVQTQASTAAPASTKPAKKPNALKQFFKRFNVYLLLFVLVVVVAAAVATVSYLNSKKTPKSPTINTQTLTQDTLKQLANSDATVGDTGQTLTVQGNAIFSGQVLIRSNLNVAGTIQLGSAFSVPELTVSNTANLASTQVNSLQVATGSTFQGIATFQNGMNVAGASSFTGPITANQITVTRLIMSGNSSLEVPNHVAFTGASPGRTVNQGVLGVGGTASINGSDTAGTVNISTGSSPQIGCFTTVTFAKPFASNPHVIISPVGSGAGQTQYYVNRTTTTFSICTANAAPANQVFAFDYFITD
ncbi:MAG TPA: hypothetical protein VLF69_03905 [Candidatus Saccharimonadales bacterium]|nr:hypothetical protein [Candidatus Saccharimonadales bacterium]